MESLIRRLALWKKVALIGLLAAIGAAVPTWLYVDNETTALASVANEREGIEPVRITVRALQVLQQHRGLSAAFLGAGTVDAAARDAKQRDVDAALKRLGEVAGKQASQVQALATEFAALAGAVGGKSISVGESSERHTTIIAGLLEISLVLVDDHELSLDPLIDSYYLVQASMVSQPRAIEFAGKLRALGVGALAKRAMTDEERMRFATVLAEARTEFQATARNFQRVRPADPALLATTSDLGKRAEAGFRATMDLAEKKVMQSKALDYPPADYLRQMTELIDAQYVVLDQSVGVLDTMLAARHGSIRNRMLEVLGALLAFFGAAGAVMFTVARSLSSSAREAVALAEAVAAGDLTHDIRVQGNDEIAALQRALDKMVRRLREMVMQVETGVSSVSTASAEIAQGNQDLSSRTEQQASSLQQTAASMEQMTSTVKHNADTANQASQLASAASEVAERGGSVVSQVVTRMGEISASSRKIEEIITVIDGIAFQTNILALNAAVEAARAGEQGRGFAVVAGEVRNLAQRSAQAAREIKTLIADSVQKVESGSTLVNEAGQTMSEIVQQVRRVTDLIGEITSATMEQSSGIGQVNQAVTHLDQMTQQNAALVEQSAAAAQSLKEQADRLAAAVAMFKLSQAEARAVIGAAQTASRHNAPMKVAAPKSAPKSASPRHTKPQSPQPKRDGAGDASGDWKEF